jgi:hypothetical protein
MTLKEQQGDFVEQNSSENYPVQHIYLKGFYESSQTQHAIVPVCI